MPTYRNLDKTPRILFLPGEQIFPWLIIYALSYLLVKKGLGLSWGWVIGASLWGIATWWILTVRGMYPFFSKFVRTPSWVRAIVPYQSMLKRHEQNRFSKTQKSPR